MLAERGAAFRGPLRLNWKELQAERRACRKGVSSETQSTGTGCDDRWHRTDAVGGVA